MENRLKAIYDAASCLFIRQGYVRTKSDDIARAIGLSTGMLYKYFKGKQEVLGFILRCTIEPSFLEKDFNYPITQKDLGNLEADIKSTFQRINASFSAPLADSAKDYPLQAMLSDAFDIISTYGTGMLLIEANTRDLGELGQFYGEYRHRFFSHVLQYLTLYMQNGSMRKVEYPTYTAQLIVETLSWWGMHVMNDAYETNKDIPVAVAKAVCMDNLLHAYAISG